MQALLLNPKYYSRGGGGFPFSVSLCRRLPDDIAGASSGCGLLGGGSEGALVLFADCINGRVIVGSGSSTPQRSRLSADRLQAGAAPMIKWSKTVLNWQCVTSRSNDPAQEKNTF